MLSYVIEDGLGLTIKEIVQTLMTPAAVIEIVGGVVLVVNRKVVIVKIVVGVPVVVILVVT